MGGVKAEQQLTTPSRLTERMNTHSSAVMSEKEPVMPTPALFTRTVNAPCSVLHGRRHGVDLLPVGHVEVGRPEWAAPLPALARSPHSAAVFSAAASSMSVHSTVAPPGGQRMGRGAADPAPGAGHEGGGAHQGEGGVASRQHVVGRVECAGPADEAERVVGPQRRVASGVIEIPTRAPARVPHRRRGLASAPRCSSVRGRRAARPPRRHHGRAAARRAPTTCATWASIMTTREVCPMPVLGPAIMKKLGKPGIDVPQ